MPSVTPRRLTLFAMHRVRTESGSADRDVGRAIGRRVSDTLARSSDHRLSSADLEHIGVRFHDEAAVEDDRVLIEVRSLRRFLPPGWSDHPRDGYLLLALGDTADELLDGLSTGDGDRGRLCDQLGQCHLLFRQCQRSTVLAASDQVIGSERLRQDLEEGANALGGHDDRGGTAVLIEQLPTATARHECLAVLINAEDKVRKAEWALVDAKKERHAARANYANVRGKSALFDGVEYVRCSQSGRYLKIEWDEFEIIKIEEIKFKESITLTL